jgi:hypothetical protein
MQDGGGLVLNDDIPACFLFPSLWLAPYVILKMAQVEGKINFQELHQLNRGTMCFQLHSPPPNAAYDVGNLFCQ